MGGVVDHGSDEWSVALGSTESKRNRTRIVRHTICKTDNDLLDGSVLYSNWYDMSLALHRPHSIRFATLCDISRLIAIKVIFRRVFGILCFATVDHAELTNTNETIPQQNLVPLENKRCHSQARMNKAGLM